VPGSARVAATRKVAAVPTSAVTAAGWVAMVGIPGSGSTTRPVRRTLWRCIGHGERARLAPTSKAWILASVEAT
jgi:hypothetical protein